MGEGQESGESQVSPPVPGLEAQPLGRELGPKSQPEGTDLEGNHHKQSPWWWRH